MENKDKKEFAEIMIALGENFSAKLTKEGLDIRFKVLAKYPLSQVKAACYKVLEERVYPGMPTIGEIIQAMKPTTPQIEHRDMKRLAYGIGNGGDKGRGRGKLNLCR